MFRTGLRERTEPDQFRRAFDATTKAIGDCREVPVRCRGYRRSKSSSESGAICDSWLWLLNHVAESPHGLDQLRFPGIDFESQLPHIDFDRIFGDVAGDAPYRIKDGASPATSPKIR